MTVFIKLAALMAYLDLDNSNYYQQNVPHFQSLLFNAKGNPF